MFNTTYLNNTIFNQRFFEDNYQIELQLIQSAQAGSLRGKVTDDQLKVLLRQIAGQKREIKITRK